MRFPAALLFALAITMSACTSQGIAASRPESVENRPIRAMKSAYFSVLMAEVCARPVANRAGVVAQLVRVRQLVVLAQSRGLGDHLAKTRTEWIRFNEVADWVCGKGDPELNLKNAVDAFATAVADAIAER